MSKLKAKLDNGTIVEYDVAGFLFNTYDASKFQCLGWGVIHEVNGVVQTHHVSISQYFFKRLAGDSNEATDCKAS